MKIKYIYLIIFLLPSIYAACTGTYEAPGPGNSCCISSVVVSSGHTDSTGQFLCVDGKIYGCKAIPNGIGTLYGDCGKRTNNTAEFYCHINKWDSNDNSNLCPQACNGTWFGGNGNEACCKLGKSFVVDDVSEENMTAYFKFESSDSHVFDNKRGLYGETQGNPTLVTSSDNVVEDNAISLDGIDDYIEVQTSPEVELDKNLTIALWIKPNNVGSNRINPIDKSYGGEFALTIETNGALSFFHGTQRASGYYTSFTALGSGKVVNGKWQFIVITRNIEDRNLTSYYNGRFENTIQYSTDPNRWPSVSTYNMTIGDGYVYNFGGVIDEVMLWNRTLSPDEVLMLYRSFPKKAQKDVIGYWTFDEGSGTTVKDSSSYGVDGSFYSDPEWTTDAKVGTALDFDGDASPNGDYISFSSNPSNFNIDIGTSQTMSLWIKPNKTNQNGYYFWKEGGCIGWSMYVESDGDLGCTFRVGNTTCTGYQSYTAITQNTNYIDGNWHHVACVVDRPNNNMTLYVDGKIVASTYVDNTLLGGGGSLRIGTQWDNNYPFNGSIDEVVVYDDKLSYDEINYIYNLEKWNKFACNNGAKTHCGSGGECTTTVNENGIPHYCSNGIFKDFRFMVDSCNNACSDQGGTWVGGGSEKNCCINSQEYWCNETSGLDTICYGGSISDCSSWCDSYGVVGTYTCTSTQDGDCTASLNCSGSNCGCLKSDEISCSGNSECSSNNCQVFNKETITDSSLGQITGLYTGSICCIKCSCAYHNTGGLDVDHCAQNTSFMVDSDQDGDLDYCDSGMWKECPDYIAENSLASDCSCVGKGIAYDAGSQWICRKPPVNLSYDGISCGIACDSDSIINDEMINQLGQCVKVKDSCSDVLTNVNWKENASSIDVQIDTTCPCGEAAICDIWAGQNHTQVSILSGNTTVIPDFSYGQNNITVSCSCTIKRVTCNQTFPALIGISGDIKSNECVTGNTCNTIVNVSNLGGVKLNTSVDFESFYQDTKNTYLSDFYEFNFSSTPSCNLFTPTWISKKSYTTLNYYANISLPGISYTINLTSNDKLIQCNSNNDCTICCSGDPSCWLNSSNPGDFACSNGVCCPSGEHFQNGACCIESERCCIDDSGCNTGEWCDNITTGFPSGNFICKDRKDLGQTCFTDRECLSGYCGGGICSDPEPVSLSEWYECSPYLANDYCSYESVSGNYTFDPQGCNIDSDCSNNFYCYVPRRSCIACAKSDTVYNNLNISDDGLCPSVSCVGSDLDCCTQDSNCASNEWCDASTSCTACSDRSDSVCSSNSCVGVDPDCCNVDLDCGEGLKCVSNTCTGNVGEVCSTDSACTGGLKCLGGVCGKQSFIVLSPQEVTYTADLGTTLKLTLIVNDPQNKQDKYTVKVDQSYVPDSAYVSIDGVKSESFEMGIGEVRKFLVSVSAAKIKESSPDIFTVLSVSSDTNPFISDSVNLQVDVTPITTRNVPAAPVNAWAAVVIIGYILGIITIG